MDSGGHLVDELGAALAVDSVDRLAALVRVREQLDALIATETAAFDGQAAFKGRGYRSPASFLVEANRVTGRAARGYLKAGRLMKSFPLLAEAALAGEISFDHVQVFTRVIGGKWASEERLALASEHEAQFLERAKANTADTFAGLCRQWLAIYNDNCPDAQARINDKVDVVYTTHDDNETAELRVVGPVLEVSLIRTAMTRFADQLWRQDNGETDETVSVMRHNRGRKFRAMVMLAKRAVGTIDKDVKLPEPLTTIHMDWATYGREATAFALGQSGSDPDAVFDPNFLSETADRVPISPRQGLAAGLLGRIRRIVIGGKSRKVDLGRSERLYVGAAREAAVIRDKHCRAPGCDMPARWCDVDHISEWQDGGRTDSDNAQVLCRFHHMQKTEGRAA